MCVYCAHHFTWNAQAIKLLLILGAGFCAIVCDEDQSLPSVPQHLYCFGSAGEDVLAGP